MKKNDLLEFILEKYVHKSLDEVIEEYRNNGFKILMENEVSTKGSDFRIEFSIKL